MTGRHGSEPDADHARQHQRGRDEQQARGEPLADHRDHGAPVDERRPEIAPEHVRDIGEELLREGPIEPESSSKECVVGRIPVLAPERDRGIPRGQVNDAEVQHEKSGRGRQDLGEPPQEIARRHAALTAGRRPPRRKAPSRP